MESSALPPPSPSSPGGQHLQVETGEMGTHQEPASSTLWDWGDLLNFAVDDDQFLISLDSVEIPSASSIPPPPPPPPEVENPIETSAKETTKAKRRERKSQAVQDRARKRDPRLTCSNFLAGIVPCACPELDEKLEQEEAMRGKKRVRTSRSNLAGGILRCQIPGCGVDITELKGYHKRHRVCLRCATATSVLLDGEFKRYCQQCGKFHVLPDFDDDKRSCRMKLERHNEIRRRKPNDSKSSVEREIEGDLNSEETGFDDEAGKDCQIVEKEAFVESEDGNVSVPHSALDSKNVNSDSNGSVGTPKHAGKDDSKFSFSPSNYDNKNFYSSVCPTGRISFKLYDWNPAEFPRRLRHQIFEWLASMPVELEGYIRPGCTILTAFLAMPTCMWAKLFEDPVSYVHKFVAVPGKMLSKRGPMLVYLNNTILHVMKDGISVVKVNTEGQTPTLHCVHPPYFEAGKPIEFVACGSNLLQPKFRLLVSFAGKYLAYEYCVALPHGCTEGCPDVDHQSCKISIPHIGSNLCGPVFIEVENESGLSNFIPVLIGDTEVCFEMKKIQQSCDASYLLDGSECEVYAQRQMAFSEFVVDIAWLLKNPSSESFQRIMSSSGIQRLDSLLKLLLLHEATAIMDKISQNLKVILCKMKIDYGNNDDNVILLQKYIDYTSDIFSQNVKKSDSLTAQLEGTVLERDCGIYSSSDVTSVAPLTSEDTEMRQNGKLGMTKNSSAIMKHDMIPLLQREVVMNMNLFHDSPKQSCSLVLFKSFRATVLLIATVAVCLGACAILLHPTKVSKLAITVRRCLADQF
ncbi:squamosa promoter-binding-like protein 7 [Mercurialis annua]|uniref:squamosa promoter-binding-like protein 7 n=1 Tax=Mercurialis annua TaxID=3986 RepID=UPI00216053C8|nr:squamosa promoter-binding-like protein 7 [Mercurialis annua]